MKQFLTFLFLSLFLGQICFAENNLSDPTLNEINSAIEELNNNSALNDEAKSSKLNLLNHAKEILSAYEKLQAEEASFSLNSQNAEQTLAQLKQELENLSAPYENQDETNLLDLDKISATLISLNQELSKAQNDLSEASSTQVDLQTLPNRAQSIISENNLRLNALNEQKVSLHGQETSLEYRLIDFELKVLKAENLFIEQQLASQTILQDIANCKISIAQTKIKNLNERITKLQEKQNHLLQLDVPKDTFVSSSLITLSSMTEELQSNELIIQALNKQLKENAQMIKELNQLDSALVTVRQVEKNLNNQINELNSSLILSRLLNRQQNAIPEIKISFNLDEIIPNLNLWLYDLQEYREQLFDENAFINSLIAKNPELIGKEQDLRSFFKLRKALIDQLYQSMSVGLANAINLKIRYEEFNTISSRISNTVNDHLFWLASNLPLGVDFVVNLPKLIMLQLKAFIQEAQTSVWIEETLSTLALILTPLIILGLSIKRLCPTLIRKDNQIAFALDKSQDSILLTPLSLLLNLIKVLPRACFMTAIGTIFITLVLDERAMQIQAALIVALHVLVFTYTLELLKPNSLAQRHFNIPPQLVARHYNFIDRVYLAVLPILVVANIRELDPYRINSDNIGFLITLIASAVLVIFMIKNIRLKFIEEDLSLLDWTKAILILLVPLTLFIMLALGYYYTAIQLINRIALSFYTILCFMVISQTIRRTLYVTEEHMLKNARLKKLQERLPTQNHGLKNQSTLKNDKKNDKIEALRFELINSRAFKLINTFLLCITAVILYAQWSDLAGVLSYLDTIHLWTSSENIDGKLTTINYLSLADLCLAILILVVTAMLNRNLPPLLERFFMLRFTGGNRSTSYTAKIVTSYIIISLGLIFAAGALGISWSNLQWLVAALSVGLGFGLQEIFGNFVSGLIILFERQIRVGDIITLDNLSGTVSKIRIRSTTIVSFDNKEVMIPNKSFITSALTNWSLSNTVTKLEFAVGVAYGSNLEQAKRILSDIILNCGNLAKDKPFSVYVTALADSAITITCDIFVNEIGKRKPTFDYLCRETLRRFDKANIEIPFNQIEVRLKNPSTGESLAVN